MTVVCFPFWLALEDVRLTAGEAVFLAIPEDRTLAELIVLVVDLSLSVLRAATFDEYELLLFAEAVLVTELLPSDLLLAEFGLLPLVTPDTGFDLVTDVFLTTCSLLLSTPVLTTEDA